MTWVKLDDAFADHPKVIGLSDRAFRLHVRALCYCARHLTDGAIPKGFGDARVIRDLVEAELWDEIADGYEVHDYLLYNPTRTDVEGSRESARERMRDVRANIEESASNPVPVPLPRKKKKKKPSEPPGFAEFYERAYPRRVGRRTAAAAWERAVKRAAPTDIIAAARRLAADPNLPEERFIPHPTTWLNRDGWEDAPPPPRGKPEPPSPWDRRGDVA